jgi:hypothetical protein
MPVKRYILAAVLFQAFLGSSHAAQAAETSMYVKLPVAIELKQSTAGGQLKIEYSVTNRSGKPIFIFDRLWSAHAHTIDANWAYVQIIGKTAIIRRLMETMPPGVHMETPPEPYGREIAPKATATGVFKIQLPISEWGPFDRMLGRTPGETVSIDKIALEIGWCPKNELELGLNELSPVKSGAEILWPFSYGQLKGVQRTVKSAPSPAKLRARVLSPL